MRYAWSVVTLRGANAWRESLKHLLRTMNTWPFAVLNSSFGWTTFLCPNVCISTSFSWCRLFHKHNCHNTFKTTLRATAAYKEQTFEQLVDCKVVAKWHWGRGEGCGPHRRDVLLSATVRLGDGLLIFEWCMFWVGWLFGVWQSQRLVWEFGMHTFWVSFSDPCCGLCQAIQAQYIWDSWALTNLWRTNSKNQKFQK